MSVYSLVFQVCQVRYYFSVSKNLVPLASSLSLGFMPTPPSQIPLIQFFVGRLRRLKLKCVFHSAIFIEKLQFYVLLVVLSFFSWSPDIDYSSECERQVEGDRYSLNFLLTLFLKDNVRFLFLKDNIIIIS